jgi:AcrR family transcriptional regulator
VTARRLSARALRGESSRYEQPRTAREAAILRAATRLFGANGYRGARTADIAAAAGVTERTLFRYFASKEALHRRIMFPAVLAATMPRELTETGKLFAADSESFAQWHRRVLRLRTDAACAAAPQFRLLLATLMSDEPVRRKVIGIWRKNLWRHALRTVRRFQKRGELRSDVRPQAIARAIISLNLGYIVARALLAPEASWDDEAEVAATVELLLAGAARRAETRRPPAPSNSVRR